MATIVTYTDREPAANRYPHRIVSPVDRDMLLHRHGGAWSPQHEGCWVFQYRRCRQCGFTVRLILSEIPDSALVEELRQILSNSFEEAVAVDLETQRAGPGTGRRRARRWRRSGGQSCGLSPRRRRCGPRTTCSPRAGMPLSAERRLTSGLVEQQRLFARLRP